MMTIELQLALGWLLFGGTHILLSTMPVRTRLIAKLGMGGFKGLYSLVALATFIALVVLFVGNRHAGTLLFVPRAWTRHLTELLMLPALLCIVLGPRTPQPATTASDFSGKRPSSPTGILRITRHPLNVGFILLGLAHMISNTTVGDWVFWGGFVVFGVLSAAHQDRRSLAAGPPEFKSFHAKTSAIPFMAILSRRQHLSLRELGWPSVVISIVLLVIIRMLHPSLIG
jgi:uncharacterized membrane protein